ncbi:MAG: hypothetical protein R3B70_14375 [Polyangiaceae bacterium]
MPKATKAPKPTTTSAAKPAVPSEAAKAFAEIEPLLAELKPDELIPIKTDVSRAVAIAVGAVPHLAKLRSNAAKIPGFDIANMDRLGTYALGAWYAHLMSMPEVAESELTRLMDEARPLRETMLLAAELLAHLDYFDRRAVADVRAGQGNLDAANDLVALSALFSARWDEVENKTPVEWAQVERASQLGPEILIALGARNQPGARVVDPTSSSERRVRAYSLFVNAYDECRRVVTFLRWNHGDADEIAPSLFANRGPRRSTSASELPAPAGLSTSPDAGSSTGSTP